MKRGSAYSEIDKNILLASKIMVNILAESLVHEGIDDITVPQFRILDMVYNDACSPVEIARMLSVSPPSISELLEKLENKGLLTRLPNTADRRKVELVLSESGLDTVEKVNDFRASCLRKILKKMGDGSAAQLQESLAEFNANYATLKNSRVEAFAERDIRRMKRNSENKMR